MTTYTKYSDLFMDTLNNRDNAILYYIRILSILHEKNRKHSRVDIPCFYISGDNAFQVSSLEGKLPPIMIIFKLSRLKYFLITSFTFVWSMSL